MAKINVPPYSDIPDAESVDFDDSKCHLGVDNVQKAIEVLCGGPLLFAECLDLGACGFTFQNLSLLYSQDGCTLIKSECPEGGA